MMKKAVEQEFDKFDAGISQLNIAEERLGSGMGNTPIEKLAKLIEEFQAKPGTLYSCKPGLTMGSVDRSGSDAVHKDLDTLAAGWLSDERNQKPLAETWEIKTIGLRPDE